MKYKVKTEVTTPGEYEIDVSMPLGTKDDAMLDHIVRKQAKDNPEGMVSLSLGERVTEVWREGVRIYPRAVKNGRKKLAPTGRETKEQRDAIRPEEPGWVDTDIKEGAA